MRGAGRGGRREAWALGALGLLALALLGPSWLWGLTPFWGDLTYLHHPWRAFDAQLVEAGRLPLWNPYLYLGMPGLAVMQDGLFYPGTLPFLLFGFPTALALFHLAHYWLAGAFAYLWLRAWGLGRLPAWTAAAAFELGGLLLARIHFLNHLAVLSLVPAFLLLARRPGALGPALALAFLAGYPTFLAGGAAAAFALAVLAARRPAAELKAAAPDWLKAGLWAAASSAVLLLPAAELAALSRRAGGVDPSESLRYAFAPGDLLLWLSPWLAGGAFSPAVDWWRSCHLGLAGFFAAARGLLAIERRRGAVLAAGLALLALLLTGTLPLPRLLRYPGNLAFLALPALTLLVAAGARRFPARRLLAACVSAELLVLAWGAAPLAPRRLFTTGGPLVPALREALDGGRYLLSPLALHSAFPQAAEDWKGRLYGLTNAPYRLRAASNFGEPLVPRANFAALDALLSARGPAEAAGLFPWLGVRVLLTPSPPPGPFRSLGRQLWEASLFTGTSARAYLLGPEGAALPASLEPVPLPRGARPLAVRAPREDRLELSSDGGKAGWVFLSEPRYPGWKAELETPLGPGSLRPIPALGPFQRFPVPAGPWTLRLRFEPASFLLGALITALALLAAAAACYNRLSRMADAA